MKPSVLQEGVDYYLENGNYVFTELFHKKRGHCCGNMCRHCPYQHEAVPLKKKETQKPTKSA